MAEDLSKRRKNALGGVFSFVINNRSEMKVKRGFI
jgi:cystathionine beta-lyase/cystathionine gamma-synthase